MPKRLTKSEFYTIKDKLWKNKAKDVWKMKDVKRSYTVVRQIAKVKSWEEYLNTYYSTPPTVSFWEKVRSWLKWK